MKKLSATLIILIILISACSPSATIPPSASAPTATQTLTAIPPTATSTPAPTATLALPVSQETAAPSSSTIITAENIVELQEIAHYFGNNIDYIAKLTKDNKNLFIADGDGVNKYDYGSMIKIVHIAIPATSLQITDDGGWILINERWLVDLRNNSQPEIRDLQAEFLLKNLYIRTVTLSPTGSLVMISDRKCSDICVWDTAKIISLDDGTQKEAPNLYGFSPTISPDGRYIAFAEQVSVDIWRTSDFEKIATITTDYPYYVSSIAFSPDGDLVAIAQNSSIKIYAVESGDIKMSIQGELCDTYNRQLMFTPNLPMRLVASSNCDFKVWWINEGKAERIQSSGDFNFSRIEFGEKGRIATIPYPYPLSNLAAYRRQYYFQFLDESTLVFKNFDQHTLDQYSCSLSLSKSSITCSNKDEKHVDGQWLGSDQILGMDGKYYRYAVDESTVKIYLKERNTLFYSLPWKGLDFDLEMVDPVHKLVIYRVALDVNNNREVIQDTETNKVLTKFEGYTYFAPIAFSENKNFAAICQKITYSGMPFVDKLMIFDLTKKAIVYSTDFTCNTGGGSLSFSNDGSKFAAEYVSSFSSNTVSVQALLLDISDGFKSQRFDVETSRASATAFTPDGSMLVLMCQDDTICFLDSSNGQEIGRLKAHSGITHITFSADGTLMATSSDWGLISLWAVPPLNGSPRQ